jgi:hypothetical protein
LQHQQLGLPILLLELCTHAPLRFSAGVTLEHAKNVLIHTSMFSIAFALIPHILSSHSNYTKLMPTVTTLTPPPLSTGLSLHGRPKQLSTSIRQRLVTNLFPSKLAPTSCTSQTMLSPPTAIWESSNSFGEARAGIVLVREIHVRLCPLERSRTPLNIHVITSVISELYQGGFPT